jgi:hypothetical protein
MTAIRYNPLTYCEKLKQNGMNAELAKVIAQQQDEMVVINNENHATKEDLSILEIRLQGFIVKALMMTVSALGVLQGIFHFIK